LQHISGLSLIVEFSGLKLGNPEPDQVTGQVMLLGEPMQGLARQISLRDLPRRVR